MKIDVRPGDWVVAVDGGLRHLHDAGITPDFILGDFDSLEMADMETVERFRAMGSEHFLQLPVAKDDTDTMATVKIGLEKGYKEFVIYGGLGGRLDHTMANVQTLVWLLRRGGHGWLLDRDTAVTVIGEGTFTVPESFMGTLSLFALDTEVRGVTIRGLKYGLENATVENGYPIGCSNETVKDKTVNEKQQAASITIGEGTALLIMTKKLINHH